MNNIIVKTIYGSRLYGTDTPTSDTDYKMVVMPPAEDILLGRIREATNVKNENVETETFSLHFFIKLALKGESVSFDMLHTPSDKLLITSPEWEFIRQNRAKFYSKNIRAYMGYARSQFIKYSVKGSRINDADRVIEFLVAKPQKARLAEMWAELPTGENIKKLVGVDGLLEYEVCTRRIQETARVEYALGIVRDFRAKYGERAKMAAKDEVDWKAMSHACRVTKQIKELATTGDIVFPLKDREWLTAVKLGKLPYDEVVKILEESMADAEEAMAKSDFPEAPNKAFWENWLVEVCRKWITLG